MTANTNNLTNEELRDWKAAFADNVLGVGVTAKEHKGVYFSRFFDYTLQYQYRNARGLILGDNGYRGSQKDNKDYYPLAKVSPSYTNEHKYCPTCPPDLDSIAKAVKESWRNYTK